MAISKLTAEIEDTYTAAGSEAYVAALLVYHYAKAERVNNYEAPPKQI